MGKQVGMDFFVVQKPHASCAQIGPFPSNQWALCQAEIEELKGSKPLSSSESQDAQTIGISAR